jgi:hypothetical protein
LWGPCCSSIYFLVLSYYVSLRSELRFVMSVNYDFRIKTMFGSSLPPVVCRRAHMSYLCYLCIVISTHIVLCFS